MEHLWLMRNQNFLWAENQFPTDPEEIISIVKYRITADAFLKVEFDKVKDNRTGCLISTKDDQNQVYAIRKTKLESLLDAVSEWRAEFGWDPTKNHKRQE